MSVCSDDDDAPRGVVLIHRPMQQRQIRHEWMQVRCSCPVYTTRHSLNGTILCGALLIDGHEAKSVPWEVSGHCLSQLPY